MNSTESPTDIEYFVFGDGKIKSEDLYNGDHGVEIEMNDGRKFYGQPRHVVYNEEAVHKSGNRLLFWVKGQEHIEFPLDLNDDGYVLKDVKHVRTVYDEDFASFTRDVQETISNHP